LINVSISPREGETKAEAFHRYVQENPGDVPNRKILDAIVTELSNLEKITPMSVLADEWFDEEHQKPIVRDNNLKMADWMAGKEKLPKQLIREGK
jgi:hypothetical protein